MAHQLRAHTALALRPSMILSIHVSSSQLLQETWCHLLTSLGAYTQVYIP